MSARPGRTPRRPGSRPGSRPGRRPNPRLAPRHLPQRPDRRAADPHHDLGAALDALRRIVRALGISARTAERSAGVTGAQLLVLQLLRDGPARSLNELAEHTFTHQSTVSVIVHRLVTRGLVTRRRSSEDARRLVLTLTRAGRVALRRAPPPAQVKLIGALEALPTATRRALAQTLETIVASMGLAAEPPGMLFDEALSPSGVSPRPVSTQRGGPRR
jgi:MarR family transcriptional regulator, lower aerobic nicotinate degradation pathway regulator